MPNGIQNPFMPDFTSPSSFGGGGPTPFSMDFGGVPQQGPTISSALGTPGGYQPDIGGTVPGGFGASFSNMMQGDFMKGLLGDPESGAGGWGGTALGLGKSLYGGYQSYKAGKRAEDVLDFQKEAFSKQFENQRTLINNELRDRDRARTARDPGYKSTTKFV